MRIINATNINDALYLGITLLRQHGEARDSRNGRTVDAGCVTTVYKHPRQNIIGLVARKANHMFHFADAMWVIAGRRDVASLVAFNKQAAAYSDNGSTFYGSYGNRLLPQYNKCIELLERDPDTRRAVMAIYGGEDTGHDSKDVPCNLSVLFRVNYNKLDMTVMNRSNDVIWGLYGSNHVQFSMIQIAFAESLGWEIGTYTHFSNSFHAYVDGPGGETYKNVCSAYDDQGLGDAYLEDTYRSAERRVLSQSRLFSTVGSSAAARLTQTRTELRDVFDADVALTIERGGNPLSGSNAKYCRAAKLLWIARVAYWYLRDGKNPSKALDALYSFQDEQGACNWSKQFIEQVKSQGKVS